MSGNKKIYLVGDITKDVYLKLDERWNRTHQDEKGTWWLDLPFNNKYHRYFRRSSVFGGAAVSADVLNRFGLVPEVSGAEIVFDEFMNMDIVTNPYSVYRYILCKDDNTAVFAPSNVYDTVWVRPEETPEVLYVDRTCILNEVEKGDLAGYLTENDGVRLAMWVNKDWLVYRDFARKFGARAEVLFVAMSDLRVNDNYEKVKKLLEQMRGLGAEAVVVMDGKNIYVSSGGEVLRLDWSIGEKDGLHTSLTTKSTIAAGFLGAKMLGKSMRECLLLAKYSVEMSTLNAAASLSVLNEEIKDKEYEVEIMESNEIHGSMINGADEGTTGSSEEVCEVGVEEESIRTIAKRLMREGKGILAADESGGSIAKKFAERGIEDTEENRRNYRNIFFTTDGLEEFVNGVILFDETARQKADDGRNFVEFLTGRGVIPGIKVDKGLEDLPGLGGEKVTLGLDELKVRLKEYYEMGCRFAKWRAAFEIGEGTPSDAAIAANVQALSRYALDCQEAGIVPIVEPEIVYDGDYTIEQCKEATSRVLFALFSEMELMGVDLEGAVLKCNMVLAGKRHEVQSTPEEVGRATAEVLRAQVPESLAGVVFLSGGQSVTQSTDNLQAVTNEGPFPWLVAFSFARALQDPAVETWVGREENVQAARDAFRERLAANTEALKKK
ncbi:fructose-bisphosphate aldolase class I [Candidatus Saccharibacteria bacterium]|nr:fructose-bisphosphate aldolase class I [Candidatus Saccharibacteria bacterium]